MAQRTTPSRERQFARLGRLMQLFGWGKITDLETVNGVPIRVSVTIEVTLDERFDEREPNLTILSKKILPPA